MKQTKLTLSLSCQYTEEELTEKRDELAEVILEINDTENRKADAAKAFKEELNGMYAQSGKLAYQIKAKEEMRAVDCIVQMNQPNVGEKTTVRLDTGEIVKTEPMTEDERQEEILFDVGSETLPVEEPNDRFAEKEGAREEVSTVNV